MKRASQQEIARRKEVAQRKGEVVGAIFFRILLERCDVFADEPEVAERLRLLIGEILMDETGHVAFCRASAAPWLLRPARTFVPRVAAAVLRDVPELALLAGGRDEVLRRVQEGLPVPWEMPWLCLEPTR